MSNLKTVFIALLAFALCGANYAQNRPAQGERRPANSGGRQAQTAATQTNTGTTGYPNAKGAPVERMKNYNTDEAYVKVALNAYSFARVLNDYIRGREGDPMTLFDLVDFCALHKIDALDATGYYFVGYPEVPTDEYIYNLKKYAFLMGVDFSGTGITNDFANPDPEARKKDVQRVKDWVDVAAKLGAPVLRVFSGKVPEGYEDKWDEVAKWMVDCLREVAEYGQSKGVMIGVQNHGDMMATGEQTVKVLKMVNHPWLGLVLDTGYFQSDDPYKDMEMCVPYAINWQVKESVTGARNLTPIDLDRIMKIVRNANYRGYLPVETLSTPGRPYDPHTLVPEFVVRVRAAIDKEFNK
jgi:sugar phosphate isomerase/epimerase